MTRTIKVPHRAAGRRLDVFLAESQDVSRSLVQRWLKDGGVTVNGQAERASYSVEQADIIVVVLPEPAAKEVVAIPDLPIVFEDDDIIVINKPAGIAVHAGNGYSTAATVADWARSRTTDPDPDRPGIVHRLDQDTSGLLVIAKSTAAKEVLQEQWRSRAVHKAYRLLTVGVVEPAEAVIDLPLGRDPARPTRRRVLKSGKSALTRYRTLVSYPGYSYIEAQPETGRTHQIRVHFAAMGHPIAGDTVYGPPRRPLGLTRQFLHATDLSFRTPSGQDVALSCPLPADLLSVLSELEAPYN